MDAFTDRYKEGKPTIFLIDSDARSGALRKVALENNGCNVFAVLVGDEPDSKEEFDAHPHDLAELKASFQKATRLASEKGRQIDGLVSRFNLPIHNQYDYNALRFLRDVDRKELPSIVITAEDEQRIAGSKKNNDIPDNMDQLKADANPRELVDAAAKRFNIPREDVRKAAQMPIGFADAEGKPTVLLVDDEYLMRHSNKMMLERLYGFEVIAVDQCANFEEIFSDNPQIDAVISDYNMNGKNGDEVIAECRSYEGCADLPAILLSGNDSETRAALDAKGLTNVTVCDKASGGIKQAAEVLKSLLGQKAGDLPPH